LTEEKNMPLILHGSTRAFVITSISADGVKKPKGRIPLARMYASK